MAQFEQYVRDRQIHWFVAGGGFGGGRFAPGGGAGTSSAISSWVTSHFASQTVGGVTVYDLTKTST